MRRLLEWVTSWRIMSRRKNSISSVPSTTSNCSNFSSGSTVSALKDKTKLTSSGIKKVVRFAEDNGKVLTEVININDRDNVLRPLEESLEEVYIKDRVISGFIKVNHLELGRQVLVRYTEDNWKHYKQVEPKRLEIKIDSRGREHIKVAKEKKGILSRRRKQINPSGDSTITNQETTYLFNIDVEQDELRQVELVIISSLNNVIDTNHEQCYQFNSSRRSWEANGTGPSPRDEYNSSNSRQL